LTWRVNITRPAELDLAEIAAWTEEAFGPVQEVRYRETILSAIIALQQGPEVRGSRPLSDTLRVLHCARSGRKASHLIVYRIGHPKEIDVLRILHERMDISRHVPKDT